MIEIYTDGGCLGNPGPGGIGVVFMKDRKIIHEHACGYKHTTNNRMEYRACIYALERVKSENLQSVTLYSDSKYVIDSVTNWGHKWKRNGWKRNKNQPIKNLDLFKSLYELNQSVDITWQWVKGHAGNLGNERADDLANGSAGWDRSKQLEDSDALLEKIANTGSESAQGSLF